MADMAKWAPVAELLTHISEDDDLILRWALRRHGDVRSSVGRDVIVEWQRRELIELIGAVLDRAKET